MNRYHAFAEGVVVMVSPVILAIALDKVNLKSEEHGVVIPIIMLVVSAITLIAGICPFLICRLHGGRAGSPHVVIKCLAPVSGACLVALACWIHFTIFHSWMYPAIGAAIGICLLFPTVKHCCGNIAAGNNEEQQYSKLENSLEFAADVTALLFVGLEGLALEGQINRNTKTRGRLTKPLGASFFACIFGACLMLLETTPLLIRDHNIMIKKMIKVVDILMTLAISLVMFFITQELTKIPAWLVFVPSFLGLLVLAFHYVVASNAPNAEICKPASLELSKIIFTGFLAVSIPSISKDSHNNSTRWFIVFAAAAILSGLVWRLMTHYDSVNYKKAASVASFCTHLLTVVAAIPFTVMAGNALMVL